jgi:excisionase family DNA binding protein
MGTNSITMRLLTADEVAGILSVSTARVYELARRNSIPALKLGQRQVRFDEATLRDWIARMSSRQTGVEEVRTHV